MKTNKRAVEFTAKAEPDIRVAGGNGLNAAKQDNLSLLKRVVLASLLGEDVAYEDGNTISDKISELIPLCNAKDVYELAIEAREIQKLRHVPLFIAIEMLKYSSHKKYVGALLPRIIKRPDEIAEALAIYWRKGKVPLAKQLKAGLANSFNSFNEYQFAKYDRNEEIKLRDAMFLTHPTPLGKEREELFNKIANRTLSTPDTWEVLYSAAKSEEDKREVWTKLITENKLGGLAFLRNLRNMISVGVSNDVIKYGFRSINSKMLVPLNIMSAAKYAPRFLPELETLFFSCLKDAPKLEGKTIFIVDVSGSMNSRLSNNSELKRIDIAISLAILAREMCENIVVYATAGHDSTRVHKTSMVTPYRGFALKEEILKYFTSGYGNALYLGGGGIFTRQCLEYIQELEGTADRIIVFSDSQDCDISKKLPNPFGKYNYIVDVSSNTRGISYKNKWTAELTGWSENFLNYILASEGVQISNLEEE